MSDTALLAFYRDEGTTHEGYTLKQILTLWPDSRLEAEHQYIQWLFPLPEKSQYNPHAPLLTSDDIHMLSGRGQEPVYPWNVSRALMRFLEFLDLVTAQRELKLRDMPYRHWVTRRNHNYLRLTRLLKFLRLTDSHFTCQLVAGKLQDIAVEHPQEVGDSPRFWTEALAA